jgi:hypothetical protein
VSNAGLCVKGDLVTAAPQDRSKNTSKRAPTEADAPLDNEGPATTYFISGGPLPSLVPPVEPEKSPLARAGLLHPRANRQIGALDSL